MIDLGMIGLPSGTASALVGSSPAPLAVLGDSITSNGLFTDATTQRRRTFGFSTWLPWLTQGRVWLPDTHNFGIGGDTTTGLLARIGSVTGASPRPVVAAVLIGTNDIASATDVGAVTIPNIRAIAERLRDAGIWAIFSPILGRNAAGSAISAARYDALNRVNFYIRNILPIDVPGTSIAHPSALFNDPTASPGPAPIAGYTVDGLHPSVSGARIVGQAFADVINARLPAANLAAFDYGDRWSADNPTGNLLTDGSLAGAGQGGIYGNVNGQSVGFTYTASAAVYPGIAVNQTGTTITVTTSRELDAAGRRWQRLLLSGNFTTNVATVLAILFPMPSPTGRIAAGDALQGMMNARVMDGAANVYGLTLTLNTTEGGVLYRQMDGDLSQTGSLSAAGYTALMRTPRRLISAVPSAADLTLNVFFAAGLQGQTVALDLWVAGASVRKI